MRRCHAEAVAVVFWYEVDGRPVRWADGAIAFMDGHAERRRVVIEEVAFERSSMRAAAMAAHDHAEANPVDVPAEYADATIYCFSHDVRW
jgi:hypothetical protein